MANRASDALVAAAGALSRRRYIALDYPTSASNRPRWGRGQPLHPGLAGLFASGHDEWCATLDMIVAYTPDLRAIAAEPAGTGSEPSWNAGNLPGLDGAALYAFTRHRRPGRYMEIGSGNSTKFVTRAVRDAQLSTVVTSIDPHPRAEIDGLCDNVIRMPLEAADLAVFGEHAPGDVVFFDGSHRTFMNSDVTVFFLDVLPALPAGVLVGIHDISLPEDYDRSTSWRYWSEQYVLAAFLLGGHRGTRIVLPAAYIRHVPELRQRLQPLWEQLPPVETHGDIFWLERI